MTDLSNRSRPPSILLVDDDTVHRTLIGLLLTSEGYTIQYANSGSDAISLHRQTPVDLVITELMLEGKNGFQMVMELRRQPVPVKVIATSKTNWIPDEHRQRVAELLGAHYVLLKPFAPDALLKAVRSALGPEPPGEPGKA